MSKETFRYHSPYATYEGCYFRVGHYADNGRVAIQIWNDTDGCITNVTVNIEYPMKDNQIAIKDYSENTGTLIEMQKIGLVTKIVSHYPSGFVSIPVCEYDKDVLEKYTS